jgi:D-inositol-3-phosphate glycosyltransferase
VAAEAQACGLPVVAARVGGLAHVVDDGRTGVLVEGWDPEEYGAVIRSLIEDPGRLTEMRERAVEWAERFSWEATVLRFLELYAGVVQRVSG